MQCCSQLVFYRGWWLKDQSIIVALKTTSNKTEVRKEDGHPPFHPLATTLICMLILSLSLSLSPSES